MKLNRLVAFGQTVGEVGSAIELAMKLDQWVIRGRETDAE